MGAAIGRLVGMLIGAALCAAAIWAVFFVDWSRPLPERPTPIRPVRVVTVGDQPQRTRTAPARVRATNEVTLAFEVPGVIRDLPMVRSQRVVEGEILAQLDDRDFRNRLDAAQTQLNQSTEEFDAVSRAFALEAATQIEVARFRAALDRARAERDIAQKALEDTTMRAPFDGIVADVFADRFQKVSPGARVMRLQGSEPIRVEVNVDTARVALSGKFDATVKHSVRFDFLPGREYPARLAEFTTEADRTTQTFLAIFEIEPPQDVTVLPGMPATLIERGAEVAEIAPGTISVPVEAVILDGSGSAYVWLVESPDGEGVATVRRAPVTVGELDEDEALVTAGLRPGEQIVVAGLRELSDRQRVRPSKGPTDAGAAPR